MSLFDTLGSLTKAVVNVVTVPVSVAADVVTLGGSLTDKDKPYTAETISDLVQNLKDAGSPK